MANKPVWLILGWSGVLPFLLLLLLAQWPTLAQEWSIEFVFIVYSGCILSFLSGSIWLTEHNVNWQGPTVYSNIITLLAFIAVVINETASIWMLSVGYLFILLLELRFKLFAKRPSSYKFMRIWLTNVVISCHILFALS